MHNYRVKFYFEGKSEPVDVTMFDRAETMTEICQHLTASDYQAFIDRNNGSTVIVRLPNVTKIRVKEVTP